MTDRDDALAQLAASTRARMTPALASAPAPLAAAIRRAFESVPVCDSTTPPPSPSTPPSSEPVARNRALVAQAWETVPERFRWVRFGSRRLSECIRIRPGAIEAFQGQASAPPVSALLIGPTGSGKTTLACAFMRAVLDHALDACEARARASRAAAERGGFLGAAPWESGALERFKRGIHSRFVAAYELARAADEAPLGQEPRLLGKARRASLLVLDDLGMDAAHRRRDVVRDLIHERHAQGRPTVITTYLTRDEIVATYGAGIRRRLGEGVVLTLGA